MASSAAVFQSAGRLGAPCSLPAKAASKSEEVRDLTQATSDRLIELAQRDDHAAFAELVCRYDQPVLRLALRLSGSESAAQDLYQEAFLRAFRNLRQFRFRCSFYTWLYRIVTNVYLDHLRRRKNRPELPGSALAVRPESAEDPLERVADGRAHADPERDLIRREIAGHLELALRRLRPRERMVFRLRHYEGLRLRTIAQILGMTPEAAKTTMFRANQKLRLALAVLH